MNELSEVSSPQPGLAEKLPMLLRIVGCAALVVAMYSFLVRGWQSGNDLSRYLLMLGHTGLLAVAGLASGHWLKESRSARLLITLALVSVPANFAILGAFVFSQSVAIDLAEIPHYVAWAVHSPQTALLTTLGAVSVLVPITWLGFSVLARDMSRALTLWFLVSNLAILLPLREPQWIAWLVSILTLGTVWFGRRTAAGQTSARTLEGLTALGLQMLPLGILLGRSLWLYHFDLFLVSVLTLTVFFGCRQVSLILSDESRFRDLMDGLSLLAALLVTPILSASLEFTEMFATAIVIPVAAFVSASLIYEISLRNSRHAIGFRRIAVTVLLLSLAFNLLIWSDLLAAASCVVIGGAMLVQGGRRQQISLFSGGALLIVAGVIHQFVALLRDFDLVGWTGLALAGIGSIVLAALLESQRDLFGHRFAVWRGRLREWER